MTVILKDNNNMEPDYFTVAINQKHHKSMQKVDMLIQVIAKGKFQIDSRGEKQHGTITNYKMMINY